MIRRLAAALALVAVLAGCAPLTKPSDPPHESRMGRFLGLVVNCGCTDVTASRMLAEYPKVVGATYDAAKVKGMRGYIDIAIGEHYGNQDAICGGVCSQRCAVENVAKALGSKSTGTAACPITDGSLSLQVGEDMSNSF